MKPKREVMWDVVSAIAFARELEPFVTKRGWAIAMGGSVLAKGASFKDLDLVAFPLRCDVQADARQMRLALKDFGMRMRHGVHVVRDRWRRLFGSLDTKHVEVWETPFGGKRVDVFFMGALEGLDADQPEPSCQLCKDTHHVGSGHMCTACPVPCERCRDGVYCANTPCDCPCHAARKR